jgi:hypothetical protein
VQPAAILYVSCNYESHAAIPVCHAAITIYGIRLVGLQNMAILE